MTHSATELEYTSLTPNIEETLVAEQQKNQQVMPRLAKFQSVQPRKEDEDGGTEVLHGVMFTHHFAQAPGDSELLTWHYVTAGAGNGEPLVFLHGLPDSWFMWHDQMAALSSTYRVIGIDLKGYGQSDKRTGDYRQEGVAEQLLALLDVLGLERVHFVTHDRGSVIVDYLGANHPERVLSYIRGEQHLYHFNPQLAPQELLFTDPEKVGILRQPHLIVVTAYTTLCTYPVADADIERTIQEFSYDKIGWAVPRYFNSSSFRKEWIDRRTRLMAAWHFPVLILQGAHDPRQPRAFYEGIEQYMPDARVQFVDGGHFFPREQPKQTTEIISAFLASLR